MRKDKILQSFLEHPILVNKYEVFKDDPKDLKVRDAMLSSNKVVRALAFIVDTLDSDKSKSHRQIYIQISQLLNENI